MKPRRAWGLVAAGLLLAACAGPTAAMKQEAAARMQMGITYLNQRNLPAAMRELTTASELDPENPEIDLGLGLAYQARGDLGKAEEHFRRAIDKKPDYADAHNNLGVLLSSMGRSKEALREFDAAVSNVLYPTPEIGYYNMGEEYRRQGDAARAEAMYRRAIGLNDRYAPAYRSLALVQASRNRYQEAAGTLERLLFLAPNNAPAWMDLGVAYRRLGRRNDALQAFRNVVTNTDDAALRKQASDHINSLGTGKR